MAKLIHKEKIILENMKYAKSSLEISTGLMFASKKKIERGMLLKMPTNKDVKYGCATTMLFVFYALEVLYINTNNEVVDKKVLKPWLPSYTPKAPANLIIESTPGKFKEIKIGDKVKIIK